MGEESAAQSAAFFGRNAHTARAPEPAAISRGMNEIDAAVEN